MCLCIAIQREEDKVKRSLKEAAKKNDKDVCKILAKEIIRARKACNKLCTSKAHLNSVALQMKNQLATIRVAGSVSKSTEVMQAMQSLVRVPEVAATMRELSKEMMKAGIIEEMLDETMDSIEESEDMEDEADEEVDKVIKSMKQTKLKCFIYKMLYIKYKRLCCFRFYGKLQRDNLEQLLQLLQKLLVSFHLHLLK